MHLQKLFQRFLLLTFLTVLPQQTSAQAVLALFFGDKIQSDKVSVGLYFAGQSSYITNTDDSKNSLGLAIGAYTDIKLGESNKWMITNFMSFKCPKGMKDIPLNYEVIENADYPADSRIQRKLTYFEIVPLLRYKFTPSLSVAAGPQFGVRIKSKDLYIDEREDGSTSTVEYKTKDYFTRFDAGLAADLQYVLEKGEGIHFNLRFCSGLTNIYKSNVPFTGHNQYFHFGVGVPIGGSKKQK
ncbi:PorT family protein [Flavobacterium alkalisoli]|uniref:PorT family protein n=1 Tax=Flavobacterium alkalisoli TaxID=2602769 RepID=A0A5B9FQC4_9FLAO|nr:outer membrane beta-barrel protein [Flavobacterium alkalisoli]QEE49025.1 PorT family protein [Flavobacterium alkalisoli]